MPNVMLNLIVQIPISADDEEDYKTQKEDVIKDLEESGYVVNVESEDDI
jgi:hypothetical protein